MPRSGRASRRFLFASSCSLYGAAGGDPMLDRAGRLQSGHGVRRVEGARRGGRVEAGRRPVQPDVLFATRRRTALLRACAPTSSSTISSGSRSRRAKCFIQSDGTPWRPLVHIEDISRAFLAVLDAPREIVHNQAFNVGELPENYQISDVAEIVREVSPAPDRRIAEGGGPDPRCYRVDCSKIAWMCRGSPEVERPARREELYDASSRTA